MDSKSIKQVCGTGIVLFGNDIDTDRIIPARFLKRVTFDGLGDHAFNDDRELAKKEGKVHPIDDPDRQSATILLVNKNFGCGSSREAAPQALFRWGMRAVIGESFGEIFYNNSIAVGLPCLRVSEITIAELQEMVANDKDLKLEVNLETRKLTAGERSFEFDVGVGPQLQFLTGSWDATSTLLAAKDEILAKARSLPYVSAW